MDILYKAGEDEALGPKMTALSLLGILVRFYIHGPLEVGDALILYSDADLQVLQEHGYLEQNKDKTLYKITGMADDENEIKAVWALFYKAYPGTKNGVAAEFKLFRAKWRAGNRWRTVLPILLLELQRQISEREAILRYNEQMAQSGQSKRQVFLQGWKNMKTWINQGCWDEHLAIPREVQQMAPAPAPVERTVPAEGDSYALYHQWALKEANDHGLTDAYACSLIPLRSEYEGMMAGRDKKPFIGWKDYTTRDSLKLSIMGWTKQFYSNTLLRATHSSLMDYYAKKYEEEYLGD